MRAGSICTEPGCPTPVNRGRCEKHRSKASLRGKVYQGCSYSSPEWRTLRAQVLREEPLCRCDEHRQDGALFGAKPDAPPSTVVDHIIAHRGDRVLFLDRSNLRGMAKRCHDAKTSREDSWHEGAA